MTARQQNSARSTQSSIQNLAKLSIQFLSDSLDNWYCFCGELFSIFLSCKSSTNNFSVTLVSTTHFMCLRFDSPFVRASSTPGRKRLEPMTNEGYRYSGYRFPPEIISFAVAARGTAREPISLWMKSSLAPTAHSKYL